MRSLTAEHRAKISEGLKGNRNAARPLTPEHRAKISAGLIGNKNTKGRKLSEEHRKKLIASCVGRVLTPEQKYKKNAATKAALDKPRVRAKMRRRMLAVWAKPGHRDERRIKLWQERREISKATWAPLRLRRTGNVAQVPADAIEALIFGGRK